MSLREVLNSLKPDSHADLKLVESSSENEEPVEKNNNLQKSKISNTNLSENQRKMILQKSASLSKFQDEKNIKITFLNEIKTKSECPSTLSSKFSKIEKEDCQIDQPKIDERVKISQDGVITKEIQVQSHYHCSRQLCRCKSFDVLAYKAKKEAEKESKQDAVSGYTTEELQVLKKVLPKGIQIVGKKTIKRKKKTSEKNKMRGAIVKLSKEIRDLKEVINQVIDRK